MRPTFRFACGACVLVAVVIASAGFLESSDHHFSTHTRDSFARGESLANADSTRLVLYLRQFGLRLSMVLTTTGDLYALLADSGDAETNVLMLLELTPDSVIPVAQPQHVGLFVPKFNRWLRLGASDVNAFYYRQPYASEAFEGATILYRVGGQFKITFRDAADACKSAELKDLDGDDVPELVEHVEHPHGRFESCISGCDLDLEADYSLYMSWQRVRRWTGTEWIEAEDQNPAFYAELAPRYQAAAAWAAENSEPWSCGEDGAAFLREWSDRAQRISGRDP